MSIVRAQHWTDMPKGNNRVTRQIRNWANVQRCKLDGSIETDWAASAPDAAPIGGMPDSWVGTDADFDIVSWKSPLQIAVKTRSDKPNWFIRRADKPRSRMRFFLPDATPAAAQVDRPNRRVTWPGFQLDLQPHAAVKTFILKDASAPTSYRIAFLIPDGYTYSVKNNVLRVFDPDGVCDFQSKPPWAEDSSTVYPSIDGRKPIRCKLDEEGELLLSEDTWIVLRLSINQEDLDGAIWPVMCDPTVEIGGTTDVEDNFIWGRSGIQNYNFGIRDPMFLGFFLGTGTALIRIANISSIPSGTITGFRLFLNVTTGGTVTTAAYFITDANDWVEGTTEDEIEVGASCYNYAKYDTQSWAGLVGCRQSGVDFDTDPNPPEHDIVFGFNTFVLDPSWPPLWRDSIRAPNGVRFFRLSGDAFFNFRSTEALSNPLYFEIDYDIPTGGQRRRDRSRDRSRNRARG